MVRKTAEYDVVVIGGGAGGMTAALYSARARLKTIMIEKSLIGGLATYTSEIENYPGFPDGIDGTELMKLFDKQMRKFGVDIKLTDVKAVSRKDGKWVVSTFRVDYIAKAVIIATGGKPRMTGAEGEEKFRDKGISFCATCDAARYTGKKVLVIGSGDAAIEEGMFLTRFCTEVKVSVVHDEGIMDCNVTAREKALANEKMTFLWNTGVDSYEGDDLLTRVNLRNLKTGEIIPVDIDGCFLFIGYLPNTAVFKDLVTLDSRGYVVTNELMETSQPGIFAAGDVRSKALRQVATAVGDGAVASYSAERYIADLETVERKILSRPKVLVYFFDASKERDRSLLQEQQALAEKEGLPLETVDTYKSDKVWRMLEAPETPSLMLFRNGSAEKAERL